MDFISNTMKLMLDAGGCQLSIRIDCLMFRALSTELQSYHITVIGFIHAVCI